MINCECSRKITNWVHFQYRAKIHNLLQKWWWERGKTRWKLGGGKCWMKQSAPAPPPHMIFDHPDPLLIHCLLVRTLDKIRTSVPRGVPELRNLSPRLPSSYRSSQSLHASHEAFWFHTIHSTALSILAHSCRLENWEKFWFGCPLSMSSTSGLWRQLWWWRVGLVGLGLAH